jgi:hypothetical protein
MSQTDDAEDYAGLPEATARPKVRIVQLLCPKRHCIVATAYESPDGEMLPEMTVRLREGFEEMVQKGANPWCGICQSRDLRPEDQPTVFATMVEAWPFLAENARLQAEAAKFFKASKG